jgi:citrate synthase
MAEGTYSKGLAGVIADESAICFVDGEGGKLYYRGHSIEDIVAHKNFDETAYLMLFGAFPSADELASYRAVLAKEYEVPDHVVTILHALPAEMHPMDALQACIAVIGDTRPSDLETDRLTDPDGTKRTVVSNLEGQRKELCRLLAKIPTIIAYNHRLRTGKEIVRPDASLDYLGNFLYMFTGERKPARDVEIFGVCEILQMEHGFNASTFTGRVVASTLSPLHSCLSAAVGSLYGKLHGGADEAAFRMARDEIGAPEKAEEFVKKALDENRKIMGMGHRVYKTVDPRAYVLKDLAVELHADKTPEKRSVFETLLRVEEVLGGIMKEQGKEIYANVEFYKGPVFNALDLPTENYTTMFLLARAFGWGAHVLELWEDHRLYRPRAQYVGEIDVAVV